MRKYVKADLIALANSGKSLKQIADRFGVSRQRMYQVFNALGIPTLEQQRKSILQTWDEKQKWAWNIITHKCSNVSKADRLTMLASLTLPECCPVLGIPLDYSFGKGTRGDNSPSIDQKIPGAGYTIDNIVVISWRANRIKNDGTPEEHQKIADFYKT